MARNKRRKKLFTVIAVLAILLLVVATATVVKTLSVNKSSDTNEVVIKDTPSVIDEGSSTEAPATSDSEQAPSQSTVDPALVLTVAVEPMNLTVSFVKGVGGFDFRVLRTPSGTKYAQFSSTKLIGTKCTNDEGQFASIVESPTVDESTTLAKTTTVDKNKYGLSLAEATCTNDPELLKQYQDAFSETFSLLKKM